MEDSRASPNFGWRGCSVHFWCRGCVALIWVMPSRRPKLGNARAIFIYKRGIVLAARDGWAPRGVVMAARNGCAPRGVALAARDGCAPYRVGLAARDGCAYAGVHVAAHDGCVPVGVVLAARDGWAPRGVVLAVYDRRHFGATFGTVSWETVDAVLFLKGILASRVLGITDKRVGM